MSYPDIQLLIDNEWRPSRSGASLAVHNPADGSAIGRVAKAGITDLDDALAASARGFEVWRKTPAMERCKLMRAAAQLLRERAPVLPAIPPVEALSEQLAALGLT